MKMKLDRMIMPKADATGRTGFSRLTGFKVDWFCKLFKFCNYVTL